MDFNPPSGSDIAQSNSYEALDRVKVLEQRVSELEKWVSQISLNIQARNNLQEP